MYVFSKSKGINFFTSVMNLDGAKIVSSIQNDLIKVPVWKILITSYLNIVIKSLKK